MAYVPVYNMTDAVNAAIDFAAGIVVSLAQQASTIGTIIVGGVLLGLLAILLDRIFGIFGGFSRKLF